MANRDTLAMMARVVGLDPSTFANDSQLEERVYFLMKNADAATGALAGGTLTSDATAPSDGDTVTIGDVVYRFVTALLGTAASGTLTSDGTAPSNNDTVTIGEKVYTFKTALSYPEVANEVLIGASAAAALDNLKSAINATAGAGTTYSTPTQIHPTVSATTNTDTTQLLVAKTIGTAGNSIVTTEAGTHTSFGAGTLTGGVDDTPNQVLIGASAAIALDNLKAAINDSGTEGTTYSYGTKAHPLVTAEANTDTTQVIAARFHNYGNGIATTESSSHLSWGDVTMTGGSPKVVAAVAVQASRVLQGNAD